MEQHEQEETVRFLDGYLRAIASINGRFGCSLASAFIIENLSDSSLQSVSRYYDSLADIEFEKEIENSIHIDVDEFVFALKNELVGVPFDCSEIILSEVFEETCFEIIRRVLDFVRIISGSESFNSIQKISYRMRSDETLVRGSIYLFEYSDRLLLLRFGKKV